MMEDKTIKFQVEFKNFTEEQINELYRFLEANKMQFEVIKSNNEYNISKETE